MKIAVIQTLLNNFEAFSKRTEDGVKFWLARDLQHLLGYTKWDNFLNVILKAKDFATETTIFNAKEKK